MTGTELEELVIRAARKAFVRRAKKVSMMDFASVLKSFKINKQQRKEQLKHYLDLAEELTNDAQFLEELKKEFGYSRIDAAKQILDTKSSR